MEYDDFKAFEHTGWEHVVQAYEDYFGRLTAQSHGALLDALRVGESSRMLDVATGPGYLAAAAIERGATAAAVDFSASMIAHARQAYPEVEFQVASADHLPFSNESFDAVGISFGMLHFPQPEQALSEAARVLRPGGRIVGSVPNGFRLKNRLRFLAGREPDDDRTHLHLFSERAIRHMLERWEDPELHCVASRFLRLGPRLFANTIVFTATTPRR